MYRIYIGNKEVEATERSLRHSENEASELTFKLLPNSSFFNKIERFITRISVLDDYNEVFDGWVVDISPEMNNAGEFSKRITALSILDYFNSISTDKWDIHPGDYEKEDEGSSDILDPFIIYTNMTVKKTLELALNKYNRDVIEGHKKIYLGNVTVNDTVYMQANRMKMLEFIQTLAERKNAFIDIRKENNRYYLDFLKEVTLKENNIILGVNMESISKDNNLENIITRIIPIGADGLTIKDVNNGKVYVDNEELKAKYGINDYVLKFDDVTIASNLKRKAIESFNTINEKTFSINCESLDLSYINNDFTRFKKSQMVYLYNPILNIKEKYRIIELEINLDEPYLSNLTFSSKPVSALRDLSLVERTMSAANLSIEISNDRLASKLSRSDLKTTLDNSATEWGLSKDGKLEGINYSFKKDTFVLGSNDNIVQRTENYSRYNHTNGEVTIIDKDGLRINDRNYLNITSEGYCILNSINSNTQLIHLDEEWINKKFIVILSIVKINITDGCSIKSIELDYSDLNFNQATFKITGICKSMDLDGNEIIEDLKVKYTVIGG